MTKTSLTGSLALACAIKPTSRKGHDQSTKHTTGIGLALALEEPEASVKRPQLGGFLAEPGIAGRLVTWLQDLKLSLLVALETL